MIIKLVKKSWVTDKTWTSHSSPNNPIFVSSQEHDSASCLLLTIQCMIWVSPRDLKADSILWEQSACGTVIYQSQRAGWEAIPFLCHLMLSLRTAILVDKCPYPWVIRDPPWEKSLTSYCASAIQPAPRVTVTTDIHHISLDTNTEKINQASSMTIHLLFYLCSLLWSSWKHDSLNNNSLWQHFSTIPSLCFWKHWHQYVWISKGEYVADLSLLQKIWAIQFVYEKRAENKSTSSFMLLSKTFPNCRGASWKHLLILCRWSSFLITNSLKAQKSARQPH